MNTIVNRKAVQLLIFFPCLFAFTACAVIKDGSKVIVPFVLLSILITILTEKDVKSLLKRNFSTPFYKVILLMTVFSVVMYYTNGFSSSVIRALLTMSCFLLFLPWHKLPNKSFNYFVFLGSLTVFINSIYYNVWLEQHRSAGPVNPIPYATFCGLLFTTSICYMIYEKLNRYRILAAAGFIMSGASIILSQSRGVWLAVALAITLLIINGFRRNIFNWKFSLGIFALIFIVAFVFKPEINQRIESTKNELVQIQQGNLNTSIGLRLQMWMLADDIIDGHYLFGIGASQLGQRLNGLYQEKIASEEIHEFSPTHLHNQFVDSLVKNGIVGLCIMLALLFIPLKHITQRPPVTRALILCSVAVFLVASLTDVPFNHPQSFTIYIILLSFLNSDQGSSL